MKRGLIALLAGVAAFVGLSGATVAYGQAARPRPLFDPFSVSRSALAGPYVGVSGGFAWGHSNQTDSGVPASLFGGGGIVPADGSFSLNGGLIGGVAGYNLQYGQWVFGLETDYSWADISGSSNGCGAAFISHTCSTRVDSLGTFRGRVGYAAGTYGDWL